MRPSSLAGAAAVVALLANLGWSWSGSALWSELAVAATLFAVVMMLWNGVRGSIWVFVSVMAIPTALALATREDWPRLLAEAVLSGGLVLSLMVTMTIVRVATIESPAILRCGEFLVQQPPGRRYAALSLGAHVFSLIMLYGSIALLGTLAVQANRAEPDAGIREIRNRRMVIAVQRGFASTLCWSPITVSLVVTVPLVPGATWTDAALPCLGSGALMLLTGWALDSWRKPSVRRSNPPPATIGCPGALVWNRIGWLSAYSSVKCRLAKALTACADFTALSPTKGSSNISVSGKRLAV
jgi:hypothetical protein